MTTAQSGLFLLNVASTLYMVGVILTVQLVHYPLMDRSDWRRFRNFTPRTPGK
jgi:hypothetical protein